MISFEEDETIPPSKEAAEMVLNYLLTKLGTDSSRCCFEREICWIRHVVAMPQHGKQYVIRYGSKTNSYIVLPANLTRLANVFGNNESTVQKVIC